MITMPWKESTAPNVMLEITDACNVSCAFCYKKLHGRMRSLEDIRQDLDANTRVLVKGSRSMQMEIIVEALLQEKSHAC